jgi:hypothetical protein
MSKAVHPFRVWEDYEAQITLKQGVVVTRDEEEINFFKRENDAGAWIKHVYGMTPHDARAKGIMIKPIANRGPRIGDLVTYRGDGDSNWSYLTHKGPVCGVIDRGCGPDTFGICFAPSVFRSSNTHVSVSGGPCPIVSADSLAFLGFGQQRYWQWSKGYSGAGESGDFFMTVPNWLWMGREMSRSKA